MNRLEILAFVLLLSFKTVLMALFSSGYEQDLFMPFVSQFLSNLGNPWNQYVLNDFNKDAFPYHPFMLHIYAFFYSPYFYLFGGSSALGSFSLLGNVFFKIPTLLADCLTFYILTRMFPKNIGQIILYYFANPIIIYAAYMHSQLDLLPTSLLVASIYLLSTNHIIASGIVFGLSTVCKLHVLGSLPFCLIFIAKRYGIRESTYFLVCFLAIYLLGTMPYLFSPGFFEMVLANPKQMTLFDAHYQVGDLQIYTVLLATSVLWGRFALYDKINIDLLISYLVIFFSVFVMLIKPGPGWYVWACPLLSVFFIKQSSSGNTVKYVYGILCFTYLTYFLFFNQFDYTSLSFLGHPVLNQTQSPVMRNVAFSILEAVTLGVVYLVYKEGVKSNSIYKRISNFVIGIGGDSGAGKTTILTHIKMFLGSGLLELGATLGIEGDADHKWERGHENWKSYTHLDPKANHLHSQTDSLLALKHGKAVNRREYDHCTGKFTESSYVKPAPYIVLCGLHPFYLPKMRKLIDLKIFLDTEERLRRLWKIRRDRSERGHSISKIVQQCESRQLDAERYIVPQKQFADIVIRYFARDAFDPLDSGASPELCLRLTLDASIQIDNLIEALKGASEDIIWDYSDDLKTQWVEFQSPVNRSLVMNMSQNLIPNMAELVHPNAEWAEGYGAILQLVILLALSEKKKARDEQEEI